MIYYNYPPYYSPPLRSYANMHTRNANRTNTGINISKSNNHPPQEEKTHKEKEAYEEPLFEIFGIKLYFDDILLICLIFFLYNEGVQDQYLFIALILLLLS